MNAALPRADAVSARAIPTPARPGGHRRGLQPARRARASSSASSATPAAASRPCCRSSMGLSEADERRRDPRRPRDRRARASTAASSSSRRRCCPGSRRATTCCSRSTRSRPDAAARASARRARAAPRARRPRRRRRPPAAPSSPPACGSASASPAPSRSSRKVLLLDEPFSLLDALHAHRAAGRAAAALAGATARPSLMVTHDVDEALLLADRIVMMTNGPAATIGEILEVPLPRPRDRADAAGRPGLLRGARAAVRRSSRRPRWSPDAGAEPERPAARVERAFAVVESGAAEVA